MIDVKQVRELAEMMAEHGLSEIRLRDGEMLVSLRKGPLGEPVVVTSHAMPPTPIMPAAPAPAPAAPSAPAPAAPASDEGLTPIRSPMVGTFYARHDPESPTFVQVGSQVDATSTVCIIEAMKVFNEIKAEISGTIERILVQNEQPVEYGQPLMLVRTK